MISILERIAATKKREVAELKQSKPLHSLSVPTRDSLRDFTAALLKQSGPAIIAEIKKASPSKGLIRADFDVEAITRIYADKGAACLSVLTDAVYFQGHPDYLAKAKRRCNLPVLRKDFIIDSYQIHESLALGADCILLIAALLDDTQLHDFCNQAQELGMAVLVESHTKEELERALRLPTPLIGINNRSLHTFETNIQLTLDLQSLVPKDRLIITESGITNKTDIKRMQSQGINAFLIGESLMRAQDIGKALEDLLDP